MEGVIERVDVVILTVIQTELDAARRALRLEDPCIRTRGGTNYLQGQIYSQRAGRFYRFALFCVGAAGNSAAAAMAGEALQTLQPHTAILMGIAAGMRNKIMIGNVALSERVVAYEPAELIKNNHGESEIPRPEIDRPSHRILQAIAHFKPDRNRLLEVFRRAGGSFPQPPSGEESKYRDDVAQDLLVKRETIGSGEKLLRNPDKLHAIRNLHGKTTVGEMEAAGFAEACRHWDVPWLVIRGISDFGDEFKNDAFHRFASCAAAAVLHEFLVDGLVLREGHAEVRPATSGSQWSMVATGSTTMQQAPNTLTMALPPLTPVQHSAQVAWPLLVLGGGVGAAAVAAPRLMACCSLPVSVVSHIALGVAAAMLAHAMLMAVKVPKPMSFALAMVGAVLVFLVVPRPTAAAECSVTGSLPTSCVVYFRASERGAPAKRIKGARIFLETTTTVSLVADALGEVRYQLQGESCAKNALVYAEAAGYGSSTPIPVTIIPDLVVPLELEAARLPPPNQPTAGSARGNGTAPRPIDIAQPPPPARTQGIRLEQEITAAFDKIDGQLQKNATDPRAARLLVETMPAILTAGHGYLACKALAALRRYSNGPCEHLSPAALRDASQHVAALTRLCPAHAVDEHKLRSCTVPTE